MSRHKQRRGRSPDDGIYELTINKEERLEVINDWLLGVTERLVIDKQGLQDRLDQSERNNVTMQANHEQEKKDAEALHEKSMRDMQHQHNQALKDLQNHHEEKEKDTNERHEHDRKEWQDIMDTQQCRIDMLEQENRSLRESFDELLCKYEEAIRQLAFKIENNPDDVWTRKEIIDAFENLPYELSLSVFQSVVVLWPDNQLWKSISSKIHESIIKKGKDKYNEIAKLNRRIEESLSKPSIHVDGDYFNGDKVEHKTEIPHVVNYNQEVKDQKNFFPSPSIEDDDEQKLIG